MADPDPRPLARTTPAFDPVAMALRGRLVHLEPLGREHVAGLAAIAFDEETWRWGLSSVMDEAALHAYLDAAFLAAAEGREIPFVQVEAASGRPIGMTRLHAIERAHRRLEIGYTWLAGPWRGRGHNTEAKLLLLEQAFDRWGAHRVEFKTDANNARSRAALAAIGATEEGTLRRHVVTVSGRVRDSVYFSIVWEEWPAIRARLEDRVASFPAP
jgi:N-acetyltransferase